jgi:hypothetical protein
MARGAAALFAGPAQNSMNTEIGYFTGSPVARNRTPPTGSPEDSASRTFSGLFPLA